MENTLKIYITINNWIKFLGTRTPGKDFSRFKYISRRQPHAYQNVYFYNENIEQFCVDNGISYIITDKLYER